MEVHIVAEFIQHNNSTATTLARQLVIAAKKHLYEQGKHQNAANIKNVTTTAANRFLSDILASIDAEIEQSTQKIIK